MRYEVIIDVNDKTESDAFEHWLLQNQHEIIAISENDRCGCCVNIFTIEISETLPLLSTFQQSHLDKNTEMYDGLEKYRIIHNK